MRPEALKALAGSDLIIHAGDIGKPEILDQLRRIAPVVAVRGNIDIESTALRPHAVQQAVVWLLRDIVSG
jgi:predicted phosphodiesterase